MSVGAHVVAVADGSTPDAVEALARTLSMHPEVEYAVPDRRVRAQRFANDEFVNAQTYLSDDAAAINAFEAWDVTTGSSATVVAVIDTGYRPHVDLAGRILPGYDFVSDSDVANDGDGRDADARDPGDWIDDADKAGAFSGDTCRKDVSSWHGTAVAGVIAANTNNGAWTAGIDWAARILPVRVLGKCGGSLSDEVDGIAWAAGLPVPGAPANVYPADVINLSLGSDGPCSGPELAVIAEALANGVTRAVVVAAGNGSKDVADDAPANCPGVIAVAATTTKGGRASYSNFGAGITLSAPGGNSSGRVGGAAGIYVLSNAGTTLPGADSVNVYNGTSFAAPMVSGIVSLMLAAAPGLTVDQVRAALVANAKPFPAGSNCDTTTCGAGIVNAEAAVKAAQAISGSVAASVVVEYYWTTRDHYFITAAPAEIAALDGAPPGGWTRTGKSFYGYLAPTAGASPVCRFYLPPAAGDSHFFSASPAECTAVAGKFPTFVYEAPNVFYIALPEPITGVCPAGTMPVYRLWNNRVDGNHRYTTDPAINAQMLARGYVPEGYGPGSVSMCSPP
ncbi:MAG: S8 family serine peptidase [Aromatoleum sp.]|nr:S8 family serine peptidase [Aromatoleum sp.]